MTSVLQAENLSVEVDHVALVSDIGFTAATGELVAVVGPNGAGKSTLLGALAGDVRITRGDVQIDGIPVRKHEIGDMALRRSVLGQHQATDIPFSVRAVVAMGRHPYRHTDQNSPDDDRRAVDAALVRMEVAHLQSRVFATLSGGEQSLVSLARVLAQEANLLLLDEPTAALDFAHQERVMNELRNDTDLGRTVVAVLHDLNSASYYATRVILMVGGRIRAEGTPRQVFSEAVLTDAYAQRMRVVDHPFRDCALILVDD